VVRTGPARLRLVSSAGTISGWNCTPSNTGGCRDALHVDRVNAEPGRGIDAGLPALAGGNAQDHVAPGRRGRRPSGGVSAEFSSAAPGIRKIFLERFEQVRELLSVAEQGFPKKDDC
jgi:hypothetical protein